jgi:hypothetical protein
VGGQGRREKEYEVEKKKGSGEVNTNKYFRNII